MNNKPDISFTLIKEVESAGGDILTAFYSS